MSEACGANDAAVAFRQRRSVWKVVLPEPLTSSETVIRFKTAGTPF